MRESVDGFVHGLAHQLDDLQEAELESDLQAVEKLSHDLSSEAARCGYPLLVEVAQATIVACQSGKSDEIRFMIEELTDLTVRVRRGSRGAA